MDERDRGQGSLSDKVKGSYRRVSVVMYVTLVIAAIAVFAAAYVPKQFSLAYTILVLIVFLITAVNDTRLIQRNSQKIVDAVVDPVTELTKVAEEISKGNLDVEVQYSSDDELGKLADSFRVTVTTLNKIIEDLGYILEEFAQGNYAVRSNCKESYVGEFENVMTHLISMVTDVSGTFKQIRESSDQVAAGAEQLAISSQDLAKGATEQASAVDDLVESVATVSEQVEANSKSTDVVHDKAKEVGMEANVSQQKMQELTEAMERISGTSQELVSVIGQIESIASQTNLLSLNASIEAARAGEAGRGFAVVAEEIGQLASESAETVQEINGIIEELTDNANKCMDIMKDMNTTSKTQIDTLTVTQDTFQELKNALDVCIETVQDIAAKMQEIDQQKDYVVGHIETLNALSANNASFTEETSATSEEIDNAVKDSMEVLDTVMNHTHELLESVERFSV